MFDGCQTMPQSAPPPRKSAAAPVDLAQVDVVTLLQALSDPVRLEIVRQLAGCPDSGELRCGEIELPAGKRTASHHLKPLASAGVIAEREQGTRKFVSLRRDDLEERFPGLLD